MSKANETKTNDNEQLSELDQKLAELNAREKELDAREKEIAEKEKILSLANSPSAISEQTRRAMESEEKRKSAKRTVELEVDADPDSINTFACAVNGVPYLIPKGKKIEVPIYVAELIESKKNAEREARIGLSKASGAKQIGQY